MTNRFKYLGLILLIGAFLVFPGSALWAATETLESRALRVELNTSPYSFRVIERSTGDVLLSQDNTFFKFASEIYPVTDATDVAKTSSSLLTWAPTARSRCIAAI